MWNAVDHHNDNNPVDENASSSGSATPPLPIRAPAPPPSSTFARSQSLGKPEVVTTKESDSVALSLLGRHTHHYPPSKLPDSEPNRAEFEELKARCAQMEKTMRWWSECTANWRDKWSKVRAERNRYKDDLKVLAIRHEATLQDLTRQLSSHKVRNYFPGGKETKTYSVQAVQANATLLSVGTNTDNAYHDQEDCADSGVFPSNNNLSDRMSRFLSDVSTFQEPSASMLQFRLDEAIKTLEAERRDKDSLLKETEALQDQKGILEAKCDELALARADLAKDLTRLKMDFNDQLRDYMRQADDHASTKNDLEQVISHLREEIERLQSENAEEWGRRERLETEKHSLERYNKKLRTQNEELLVRVERLSAHNSLQANNDLVKLQSDLERSKSDLSDLKHSNVKLKKTLSDANEEMLHWQRKSENSDKEIRSLRLRIEQLKSELGEAQDDIDNSNTALRRMERTNEELSSQCETLTVQVEHLSSRLRTSLPEFSFRRISRASAPGGMIIRPISGDNDLSSSTTDEEEFESVNETDV